MHEHGARAVASKKESSINVGMSQHKAGLVDCFISAGNTGAMLAASLFILKAIEGIHRPTINSPLPRPNGPDGLMLDVGFNADCKPETLRQFGLLGSIYAKEIAGIDNPRVALLNIGEEKEKGSMAAQQAYALLEEDKNINFVGNIEGRDLFNSKVADVVVCDGFTGNIVLKTAEGLFYEISKSGAKSEFLSKINFENYAGIPVLGVDGNAMIGHGISKAETFYKMLKLAANVINHNIVGKIKSAL
jgi:glycerol-3-phosphate acyltransferase PlsX